VIPTVKPAKSLAVGLQDTTIVTMCRSARTRRAFSLVEVSLTILVIGITLGMTAPHLTAGDKASAVRQAHIAAETAMNAIVSTGFNGTGELDPLVVSPLLPKITIVGEEFSSGSPQVVSAGTSGSTVAVAVGDGSDGCWMVLRNFSAVSGAAEMHVTSSAGGDCNAQVALSYRNQVPPDGRGETWSKVWEVS
jgi:type II secretory pathway pseudopilin PulG